MWALVTELLFSFVLLAFLVISCQNVLHIASGSVRSVLTYVHNQLDHELGEGEGVADEEENVTTRVVRRRVILKKTTARAIPPGTRTVTVLDAAHMPHDYSSTPGGTVFSTTPGGTRIIYDRKFLLECRSSPVAKTPPQGLPHIPGVTGPPSKEPSDKSHAPLLNTNSITAPHGCHTGDEQFQMDI